jgi:hypothetical protein
MAVSSAGLRLKSGCSGKAQKQLYSKLQSHPLVREGAPYKETHNSQKTKIWSWAPDGSQTPRYTGRLTVGRKLTSTSTGIPVPGGNKYRNLAFQVGGVSKLQTIKYAQESPATEI